METKLPGTIPKPAHGSYPTYEEWKHLKSQLINLQTCSSYPTYEEWKLSAFISFIRISLLSVLILPMRNGNSSRRKLLSPRFFVLILPMRNGNKRKIYRYFFQFTPRSYPTYEEWKL